MFSDGTSRLTRLLRWSERYTKTDMVYLASGGTWSLIGQAAAAISSLALSVVISRYVSKDAYGTYQYALSVVALLGIFSLNDIGGAVMQSVARGFDGALSEGFRTSLRWSGLIFVGGIAVATYYLLAGNIALAFAILIGGTLSPFMGSINLYISFLNGKKDFARATIYADILGNFFPVAFLLITAYFLPNFLALTAVYFIANTVADYYFYLRTKAIYRPDESRRDPGMTSYGKHLSLIGVLGGIAGTIDQILLFHFMGAADLALYAFTTGIVDQSKGPLKNLDNMLQARFAPRDDADIHRSMRNKMLWLFVLSIVAVIAYFFFAPIFYRILFPAYLAAVPYSRAYALTLLGIAIVPLGSYFAAKKLLREQYVVTVFVSVARIAMMTVGIIMWGLWGLIVARIAASLLTVMLTGGLYVIAVRRERHDSM